MSDSDGCDSLSQGVHKMAARLLAGMFKLIAYPPLAVKQMTRRKARISSLARAVDLFFYCMATQAQEKL